MPVVVVVGMGRIGCGVAASLVRAGHTVWVVDTRTEVRPAAEEVGAHWGGTAVTGIPAGEVLLTVLPGSPELRVVMFGTTPGETGVFDRMQAGSTWIDLTSAAPDLASELSAAARQRGVHYLDAALGGDADAAAQAELSLYVGGESEVFERNRPMLEDIAAPSRIHYMGGPGAGYLTKLLINQLWFTQVVAVEEVLLLGKSSGLDVSLLQQALQAGPASSDFMSDYLPLLMRGDYLPAFGLDRIVEELDSLQRAAHAQSVPFALAAQVAALHQDALTHFGPVDGELLAAAYLEHLARCRVADRPADPES